MSSPSVKSSGKLKASKVAKRSPTLVAGYARSPRVIGESKSPRTLPKTEKTPPTPKLRGGCGGDEAAAKVEKTTTQTKKTEKTDKGLPVKREGGKLEGKSQVLSSPKRTGGRLGWCQVPFEPYWIQCEVPEYVPGPVGQAGLALGQGVADVGAGVGSVVAAPFVLLGGGYAMGMERAEKAQDQRSAGDLTYCQVPGTNQVTLCDVPTYVPGPVGQAGLALGQGVADVGAGVGSVVASPFVLLGGGVAAGTERNPKGGEKAGEVRTGGDPPRGPGGGGGGGRHPGGGGGGRHPGGGGGRQNVNVYGGGGAGVGFATGLIAGTALGGLAFAPYYGGYYGPYGPYPYPYPYPVYPPYGPYPPYIV